MLDVLRTGGGDLDVLVGAVAAERGLPEAMVEKDLWVCYLLDHLFHRSPFGRSMVFKGGTSLSKAFGVIERFSEDVDLILDWRVLGYGADEPWEERSHSAQERFRADAALRTDDFLSGEFSRTLEEGISEELGIDADVRAVPGEETVLFAYPRRFASPAALEVVRLEVGPLAAWSPHADAAITPYVAESHPELFSSPSTVVPTAVPERTFWEKATILHQEANRPDSKRLPRRYARHYYDMHRLALTAVADRAIGRPGLLADVVAFKEKFYRTPWAMLSEARPGTIRLAPRPSRVDELASDYSAMEPMIYGDVPRFSDVVDSLAALESRINGGAGDP